jgi:hypothetical protein
VLDPVYLDYSTKIRSVFHFVSSRCVRGRTGRRMARWLAIRRRGFFLTVLFSRVPTARRIRGENEGLIETTTYSNTRRRVLAYHASAPA